ncbi:conserved hypothetical protein [Ricinus communis]|uniref:Salutaridinol 7-O-acetyltransferase n=1 Tax=Ricinus communis TaxID=3988 RepID=B9RGD8_RICCO|nr:conserved hypothetical protein [Ricinus communis]
MEVAVISVESIRPCLPVFHQKPFKLCLLDQLTPTTYSPLILFYPMNDAHLRTTQVSTQLKWSLSKTLTPFYPLSGRVKDNFIISNFYEGVPYIEARVNGHLSDFLQHPQMDLLNRFLPCQPFCQQPDPTVAQLVVQVNIFDCGGIALGMCFSHKINDGITGTTLTANGKSELIHNPTRVEALSAFIWRSAMKACRSISGSSRPSVLSQAVNIRRLMKPRLSRYSIGNLVWSAIARYNPEETEIEIQELVALLRDGVTRINSEYIKAISGDEGSTGIFDHLNKLSEMSSENPDVFSFFSWHTFDFNDIDFGWGKPIWVGIFGEASRNSPCDSNFIILKDIGRKNEIEAWMTLDENIMAILEHDPEFLAIAALNPNTMMEQNKVLQYI